MKKRVERSWKLYQHHVVPADAPEVQITECRNAFFAGATHLYTEIMNALSPGEDPSTADLTMMQELHDELQEFKRQVTAEKGRD